MATNEKFLEKFATDLVYKTWPDAQVHKYTPRKGEPDRLWLLPGGRAVFVEFKRAGETPREDQMRALVRLEQLGFTATWVSSRDQVRRFIESLGDV